MDETIYFAKTTFRNKLTKFGVKQDDRRRHMYVIGKTGMGKTVMLENMAIQDIQAGHGVGIVDPHGEFADRLLDFVPKERIQDVIYFDPADLNHPIAFNIFERVAPESRHLVASGLMGVFKKIWPDVWSPRMEYILNNTVLALLEFDGATMLGINRLLADKDYRKRIVERLTDPIVKSFWQQEFAKYFDRFQTEAVAPIQNKAGQFVSAALIRNIIGQLHSAIDMRKIMDEGKILIMNLSKGKIGEDNSRLLGALLITKLQLAAMSRVDISREENRRDFYLYVDEFQNFATESFANILSEARKYRLNLILAHQYIAQLDEKVRDAVFGNVGTLLSFRVGAEDAEFLEKEFSPEFTAPDIVNLAKYHIYLRLMIDGVASRPFSALTLPPLPEQEKSYKKEIIEFSRKTYGTPKDQVVKRIEEWVKPIMVEAEKKDDFSKSEFSRGSFTQSQKKRLFSATPPSVNSLMTPPLARGFEKPSFLPSKTEFSLEEATKKEPRYFSGKPPQQNTKPEDKKEKKEVNLAELRKVLEESIGEIKKEEKRED